MDGGVLVSGQLSALYPPSQATSIPIQTSRRNTPLPNPPNESDPPPEHALSSSVFHSDTTGTILMRVLHGGLIIELVSLTNDVTPIRFVFPAVVLPSPSIFLWQSDEIHMLALTKTGSLYRIILPARDPNHLWHEPLSRNWCREYLIKAVTGESLGMVQMQGTHSVAVALQNGSLLRLEASNIGGDMEDGKLDRTSFVISIYNIF
jgi:nuclear pore complex protein Nup160